MHLLKMPTFHFMISVKSFPTPETSPPCHVSYFATKLLRPRNISQCLRSNPFGGGYNQYHSTGEYHCSGKANSWSIYIYSRFSRGEGILSQLEGDGFRD